MSGLLDGSRFEYYLAQAIGCPVRDINAMVIGAHGDLMVPLTRFASYKVKLGDFCRANNVSETSFKKWL
ncbi:hypothetical protein V9039_06005, partial [Streptococcus anginosus]